MDNLILLMILEFIVGTLGTLIGAGGGFILVPLLRIMQPTFSPEIIAAISMAIVACNAISGSVAYISFKRVDFKAGLIFSLFTFQVLYWVCSLQNTSHERYLIFCLESYYSD